MWQKTMVALARSAPLERIMQGSRWFDDLSRRFVGGADAEEAAACAGELAARGLRASLYYLGEYVTDPGLIEENTARKEDIAGRLWEAALDVHVSVDPTQIGYARSDTLGMQNALRIACSIPTVPANEGNPRRHALMLDMEDFSVVDKTLALHDHLRGQGLATAVTVQAYLHRSRADIERLARQGAFVRLVKGAFAERRSRAFMRRSEIDRAYLELAGLLLSPEARENGCYPAFGTHDEAMICGVRSLARTHGWEPHMYEIEMLFGVRRPLQEALVRQGERVRLYVPFGRAWWPYTVRRIGENPANIRFVLRALWAR